MRLNKHAAESAEITFHTESARNSQIIQLIGVWHYVHLYCLPCWKYSSNQT